MMKKTNTLKQQLQPRLWLLLSASLTIMLFSPILSKAQELPKDFDSKVLVEYSCLIGDEHECQHGDEFELTFEAYHQLRKDEYLSGRKFLEQVANLKSFTNLCDNGTFESGEINVADWQFYWYGGSATGGDFGMNRLNTGSFNSGGAHDLQVHHQVQDAGPDDYVNIIDKVYSFPAGNTRSLRLGNANSSFGKESIAKQVEITAANADLSFSYAVVMNDPSSHSDAEKPYFSVQIIDPITLMPISGLIDLGNGDDTLPSNHPLLTAFSGTIVYKDWSCVTADLSSLIGEDVIIKFETRDCWQGAHMGYAYVDNICLGCGGAPSDEGAIDLNIVQTDSCSLPGQICIDYSLPLGNLPSLDISLDLIQNGAIVSTLSSPTLTSDSLYCFDLDAANTAGLDLLLGGLDYRITGNFTLGAFNFTPQIIGTLAEGVTELTNNDYLFECPTGIPVCGCEYELKAYDPVTLNEGGPYTNSVVVNGDRITMEVLWEVIETCDGGTPEVIDTYTTNELSIALSFSVPATSINQHATLPVIDNGVPTNLAIPNFNATTVNDYIDSLALYLNNSNLGATFTTTGSRVYQQIESGFTGGFQLTSPVFLTRSSCSNCTFNDSYSTPCGNLQYTKTVVGTPSPPSNYLNFFTVTYNSITENTNLTVTEGGANGGHNPYMDCTEPCPEICYNEIDDDGDGMVDEDCVPLCGCDYEIKAYDPYTLDEGGPYTNSVVVGGDRISTEVLWEVVETCDGGTPQVIQSNVTNEFMLLYWFSISPAVINEYSSLPVVDNGVPTTIAVPTYNVSTITEYVDSLYALLVGLNLGVPFVDQGTSVSHRIDAPNTGGFQFTAPVAIRQSGCNSCRISETYTAPCGFIVYWQTPDIPITDVTNNFDLTYNSITEVVNFVTSEGGPFSSHNPYIDCSEPCPEICDNGIDDDGDELIDCDDPDCEDTEPPTITCPEDIMMSTDLGVCDAVVTWADPVAVDNCDNVIPNSFYSSGDTFPLGTTTVSYTVTDSAGNVATCDFDVTVEDNEPPIANCISFGDNLPAMQIELSTLDGINGFAIEGIDSGDGCGRSVSHAGDINNDGFADIVIGAATSTPNGVNNSGESYVIYGGNSIGSIIDLATLSPSQGFIINGIDINDNTGSSVSSAGDVNNDGISDFMIGVPGGSPNGSRSGEIYVFYGGNSLGATIELSAFSPSQGFLVNGIEGGAGASVSNAGDVNNDGFSDVIIGAAWADPNGISNAGESYVIYGGNSISSPIELPTLSPSQGFAIRGIDANDYSGYSVSGAGDVNNDGFSDVIIGAYQADPNGISNAGESYVIYGGNSIGGTIELSTLSPSQGFVINGISTDDVSGHSVSDAGDINNDGFSDIIIGAGDGDPNGISNAGESYVIYGGNSIGGTIELSTLSPSQGFVINGINANDEYGLAVSNAGDVNNDGISDLIVGARFADPNFNNTAGESAVVYGSNSIGATVELSTLSLTQGFIINGASVGDWSGYSVSSAGDVNNDGFSDVIIGALQANPNGSTTGASYVVYGGNFVTGSALTLQLDANSMASISPEDIDNGSSDNCGIASMTVSPNTFDCSNIGDNTVILTVTDDNGNSSTCSTTVTIEDNELPTITCPADIAISTDPGVCDAVVTWSNPVTTDNCGVVSLTSTHNSGDTFPLGITTVSYTATDDAGNVATCDFDITVEDNEPPIITCPEDITVTADAGAIDAVVTWTLPTTSDNCPGTTLTSSQNSGDTFPVGTTTVNYTVTDAAGNVATCDFDVIVEASFPSTCLSFDGNDDQITAPNTPLNSIGTGDFTFEAWVQADAVGQSTHPAIFSNRGGGGTMFFLHNNWNGSAVKMLTVQLGGTNYFVYNNGPNIVNILDGACHHLAITRQANLLTHYIDGVFIGTRNISGNPSTSSSRSTMLIGDETTTNNNFQGHISDVRIWDVARTAIEIQSSAGTFLTGTESNLVANWPLNANNGQIVADIAPNGYDGTLGATTAVESSDPTWGENCCSTCEAELVIDGDFDDPACPTFTSGLDQNCACDQSWCIETDPRNKCLGLGWINLAAPAGASPTYLIIDGYNNGTGMIWSQLVQVEAGTNYEFSFWYYPNISSNSSTPNLDIRLDGVIFGNTSGIASTWTEFTFSVLASTTGLMPLEIYQTNDGIYNDFAIDNISFLGGCIPTDACAIGVDCEPPTITCPEDITASTPNGACISPVTWNAPITADNCDVVSVTSTHDSGDTFTVGTTTVIYTVTDASGNTSTCSFDITLEDNQLPTIICPADITISTDPGVCDASVDWNEPIAADNCAIASVTSNYGSGDDFPLGTTTVSYTVTDNAGNIATCSFDITVEDTEPPTITCPADIMVSTDPGTCEAVVTWTEPITDDNCLVDGANSLYSSGDAFPLGTTTVIYVVTDDTGNEATCSFDITVEDTEPPTITCPEDITVSTDAGTCDAVVTWTNPVNMDNCSIATVISTHNSGDTFPLGLTTVTYTVTDDAGNTATCDFEIAVEDNEPPSITCPADISTSTDTGVCLATGVALGVPLTSDNCPGTTVSNDAPASYPVGMTTVIWTVTDGAGSTGTCEQTVTIIDDEAPVANCISTGNDMPAMQIDPNMLDGTNGFVVNGIDAGDQSGFSVSYAGDVNNDGFSDIIIGAPQARPNGNAFAGETYVIYGGNSIGNTIELSTLSPSQGFIINGIDFGDYSGRSVSSAGDVNNDGFSDIIIGAYAAHPSGVPDAGETYVIYGGNSIGGTINLSALSASQGFVINGIDDNDNSGVSVSSVGDVNNDGFSDIIIGANRADPTGAPGAGETYVIYGGSSIGSNINLSTLASTQGFIINGIVSNDNSGISVNGAGDVNNDGFSDIIIGANWADPNSASSGQTYVIYGGNSIGNTIDLSTLSPSQGFIVNGISYGNFSGYSANGAGDVNNDGFSDVIIGAHGMGANGNTSSGATYVIYGGSSIGGIIELSTLSPSQGFTINGIDVGDWSGRSVSSAGDINNDGFSDIIIGASGADPSGNSGAGETYVIYGGNSIGGTINLSALSASQGFIINGIDEDDNSGESVSGAGDINNDGFADIIIGANYADPSGNSGAGETYVIYGGNFVSGSVLTLQLDANNMASISPADIDDGSTDNCGIASMTVSPNTFDCDDIGDNTVVLTVTDINGNSSTCSTIVTIEDNQPPTITCPADITVSTDAGTCDAVATWTDPVTIDNCGVVTVMSSHNSGDTFPLGTTTVTYTVTDNSGNTATCDFNITVEDTEPPTITCPEDITVATDPGTCDAVVTWSVSATDNCDNVIPNSLYSSGDTFPLGTTTVSYTATDNAGNVLTCDFNIIVIDNEPPVANCISDAGNTLPTQIELSTLDGTNGLIIHGIDFDDNSGYSVNSAGDVNNDGFSDMIIGAIAASPTGIVNTGQAYVVYGGNTLGSVIELSTLSPSQGFFINGIDASDLSGFSVSSAGDVNNDGFADIIIGAPLADPNGKVTAGEAYVIYGSNSIGGSIDLATLSPTQGFTMYGIDVGDYLGHSVSSAGDVNNDGFSDIVVGARYADVNGVVDAGQTYVIYGGNSIGGVIDMSSLSPTQGFMINGIDLLDDSAYSVSGAGDVNNDGFSDVIIGAFDGDPNGVANAGESYVVYGGNSIGGTINLSTLSPAQGFIINGIDVNDRSGHSVSDAGDVNNDGFSDILIGAYQADPNGNTTAGESYVIYGGNSIGGTINLSTLSPTQGFIINGIDTDDRSGWSVSSAGDINNDGFSDIIIGAYQADPNGSGTAGESYLIYGGNSIGANINLSTLIPTQGFIINGIDPNDRSGWAVSSAGDINNDGFSDVIIGAPLADPNSNLGSGESYVIYGGNFVASSVLTLQLDGNNTASISPSDIDDGSTDNCGIAFMTVNPNTFDCSNIGDNTVILTVTDISGNSSTCSTIITIEDNQVPTITCPADITVSTAPGACDAVATWTEPVATDNCGTVTTSSTHNSGDTFPLGTTTVIYTVTDDAGNVATCDFNITVEDNEAPTIICPEDIIVTADEGAIDVVVTWTLPITSDNCPGTTLTSLYNSGDAFPIGTTTVNYTVTDASGNMATCDFEVTVEEFIPSNCLYFDGNDDRITAPNAGLNSIGSGDFTFETWIQADAAGQSSHPIIFSNRPSSGSGVMFFLHNQWNGSAVKMLTVQLGGSNYFVYNNGPDAIDVLDGNCHHLAISRQGNLLTHYIDGAFIGTRNISGNPSASSGSTNMLIGREAFGNDDFLGHISDVRIWNVARTATEIQNTANIALLGTETDLVANWKLEAGGGQVVFDNSTNAYDGVLGSNTSIETTDPQWGQNCCNVCEMDAFACYDFNDLTPTDTYNTNSAGNWTAMLSDIGIFSSNSIDGTPYLQANDNSGNSWIYNNIDFSGDWLQEGCELCFDYNFVSSNGCPTNTRISVIYVYQGADPVSASSRVYFRLDNPIIVGSGWQTICMPLEACVGTDLPSNAEGEWRWSTAGTDCTEFNTLLGNVSGIGFPIDNSCSLQSETHAFDNFCFTECCDPCYPIELVIDGDFDDPTGASFTSGLLENCVCDPESWCIDTDALNKCTAGGWTSLNAPAGNSPNFLIFDGFNNPPGVVWSQPVSVEIGRTYEFSFWYYPDMTGQSTNNLEIRLDGVTFDNTSGVAGTWTEYTFSVEATTTGTVPLEIVQTNSGTYNDFGIDGISFHADCGVVDPCDPAVDVELPVITCPEDMTISTDLGTCDAAVTWSDPVTTDNCAVASVTSTHNSGDTFPLGTTTVSYTVTDEAGNMATCDFDVTVEDNEPPTISCPEDIIAPTAPGVCYAVVMWNEPLATDNCAVATISSTHNSGDAFLEGTTTVMYTVTDDAGNVATCSFEVIVEDNEPPSFICPSDISISTALGACDAVATWELILARDNCDVVPTISSTHNSGDTFPLGTTTVSYTLTDDAGNMTTCDFDVTVEDNEPPTITCPADITASGAPGACDVAVTWSVLPTDNCAIASISSTHNSGDVFPLGITTVGYTVTDDAGNVTTCDFDIEVLGIDIPPPTITCPPDETVECVDEILPSIENAIIGTSCGANATVTIINLEEVGEMNCPGSVCTFTYQVEDEYGGIATCEQVYTFDNEPPTITCPSGGLIPCSYSIDDINVDPSDAIVTSSCGMDYTVIISDTIIQPGDGTAAFSFSSNLGNTIPNCLGTQYIFVYTVEDACGRQASCQQVFTLVGEPVTIQCPGDQTVSSTDEIFVDPANAILGGSSCGSTSVEISGPVVSGGTNCLDSTYTYVYQVIDSCGFTGLSCEQVFTIPGNPLPLEISGNLEVCLGDPTVLTVTGGSGDYAWSQGGTGSSIVFAPNQTGNYTILVNDNNCQLSDNVVVMVEECCVDTLYVGQTIASGLYPAIQKVISDGKVLPGSNVDFTAENIDIELNVGFCVEPGAVFSAVIDPCEGGILSLNNNLNTAINFTTTSYTGELQLYLSEKTKLQVDVYNQKTNQVYQLINEEIRKQGIHEYLLDLSELPAGNYRLELNTGKETYTEEFIINRL